MGIPDGTIIYFGVDCDPQNEEITDNIIPYFAKVFATMVNTYKNKYQIGVYGTRNVCSRVSDIGLAISSYVANVYSGFSGNIGYPMPSNWAFDQFTFDTVSYESKQVYIFIDIYSGRDSGIGRDGLIDIEKAYNNLKDLYRYVYAYKGSGVKEANMLALQYLRHLAEDNKYGIDSSTTDLWAIIAGPSDFQLNKTIDTIRSFSENDFRFKDANNNEVLYDMLHFAATVNALLYTIVNPEFLDLDSFVDNYAGWAGDAVTFAIDIKEGSLTQERANSLICTKDKSFFGIADYYADIDGVVFVDMLKKDLMTLPEMFYKYFMTINLSTGESYLKRRTNEFLRLQGTYNTLVETCDIVLNSDIFPYPMLRSRLVDLPGDFTKEYQMATIAFLKFIGEEALRERR